ncbi:MAG: hypothetical protein IPL96_12405 [Holophagaceae bacterium]|nr:hypothetical protein [Holophagaceae bacterium]
MEAYRRSSKRYRALRASMGEPDPVRLRYREALREWVRQAVQSHWAASEPPSRLEAFVRSNAPEPDRTRLQALALQELRNLNEGNIAWYGLRPSEFEAWRINQAQR